MSDADDDTEKSHEPTQKKLDDARRRGEVPKSADVTTASAYGGLLLVAASIGPASLGVAGAALAALLARSDALASLWFEGSGPAIARGLSGDLVWALAPWFLVPAVAALLAVLAQRSLVVAPTKLMPKLSRISPIANAKNKFGLNGLFEFAKSATKLLVYGTVLALFLMDRLPEILAAMLSTPAGAVALLLELSMRFLALVLVIAVIIGAIDYLWQRAEHFRRHRMSHKELRDENKTQEGDPTLKQERRQRGYDIATNRMLADVPKADVVIANPTHYAIALKWSRSRGSAPVCVAKGVDVVARRIRDAAAEAGVPIHRDPPTARALHAEVQIGEQIWPEHYEAVAAAIRFAEAMRQKARARPRWS